MRTLKEVIFAYKKEGKAIGHFNISDSNQLHAVAHAAKDAKLPVVVGLSEGEREFFPLREVRALVDLYQKDSVEIYLNADHTYSLEKAKAAIDAGVDSIVVDGAKLAFEENVQLLKGVVAYAKSKAGFFGGGSRPLVEGELGYIGQSSSVMDKLPEGAAVSLEMMTKPEELKKLVDATGIDLAAPAVGNIHGVVTSGQPKLSISRISELAKTAGVPLVLHGGSGSPDEEFTAAVKAGMTMIHINTDIRVIYKEELKKALESGSDVAPYKFMGSAVAAQQLYITQKIRLFAGI
jgi:fructose-bisphosphate aldolase class II